MTALAKNVVVSRDNSIAWRNFLAASTDPLLHFLASVFHDRFLAVEIQCSDLSCREWIDSSGLRIHDLVAQFLKTAHAFTKLPASDIFWLRLPSTHLRARIVSIVDLISNRLEMKQGRKFEFVFSFSTLLGVDFRTVFHTANLILIAL